MAHSAKKRDGYYDDGFEQLSPILDTNYVTLQNGRNVYIDEVKIGHNVKVLKHNGTFGYSKVVAIRPRNNRKSSFRKLQTAHRYIELHASQCIKVLSDGEISEKIAQNVQEGDSTVTDNNGRVWYEEVKNVSTFESTGVFAPITPEGNIVINGVVASCYSNMHPAFAV